MASMEKSIEVNVPVSTAYNQWTQFEEFPGFMEGVREVHQLDEKRLHWRAEIAGREKEWNAEIVEQTPDRVVSWRSTTGAQNNGTVTFAPIDDSNTRVTLRIEYEPEGLIENVGDALGFVSRQIEGDLERFKEFIESRHTATGAWRGEIHSGEVTGEPGRKGGTGRAAAAGSPAGPMGSSEAVCETDLEESGPTTESDERWREEGPTGSRPSMSGMGGSPGIGNIPSTHIPSGLEATTEYTEAPGRGSLRHTAGNQPSEDMDTAGEYERDRETGNVDPNSWRGLGGTGAMQSGNRPFQGDLPCEDEEDAGTDAQEGTEKPK